MAIINVHIESIFYISTYSANKISVEVFNEVVVMLTKKEECRKMWNGM